MRDHERLVGAMHNLAHAVGLLPDAELVAWAARCLLEARAYNDVADLGGTDAVTALACSDAWQALADFVLTIAEIPNEKEADSGHS